MLHSRRRLSQTLRSLIKGTDGRILRRTFVIAALLVSGGVLTSSGVEMVFHTGESVENIHNLQQNLAHHAAFKIQQFVISITQTLNTATQTSDIIQSGLTPAYRFQLLKLLRVSPAITNVFVLDSTGKEQLKMSRVSTMEWDDLADRSHDVAFQHAISGNSFFGPVYFVRQSEPHMQIAVPIEQFASKAIGVLIAEVNLTYIWNVISNLTIGETGYAYVISPEGDLIAHSDMSLALQRRNLSHLSQVQDALNQIQNQTNRQNLQGEQVFATYTLIPALGWVVFVERLRSEAYAPLYASLSRMALLLLLGLGMAGLATILIGRRVIRPVEELKQGAEIFGTGTLGHRIQLNTGDEFQVLADTLNSMAAQLQTSYSHLEQEVEARTRELALSVEELEVVSQHKSRFLANMTHELHTPLVVILGYTDLILDGCYGDISPDVQDVLQQLHHSAEHLLKVINDVLDISRIESGRVELSLADYSMLDIVQSVVFSVEQLIRKNNLSLNVSIPPDLPTGLGDERRLTQLLLNLMTNAITYTEEGEIGLDVTACDRNFRINVTDTGPGIATTDQQRIFDSFERVDMSDTRLYGGTGLGLAICKNIVEFHGGHIDVMSSPGHGSTFSCTFPIRVKPEKAA